MSKQKFFLSSNIDAAIVMTQFDLRGFWHPLGFRVKKNNPKNLDAITCNLAGFAAGLGNEKGKKCTDEAFASYHSSSFEDYLAMCKQLAKCCNRAQKEAIQLIIQEIVKQNKDMQAEVAAGKVERSSYLNPLREDNRWGKAVIALAKAFKVTLKK